VLPAIFDQTTIDISAGDYTFLATGSGRNSTLFALYRCPRRPQIAQDDEKDDEGEAARFLRLWKGKLSLGQRFSCPDQHFTERRRGFNDATLVKELEETASGGLRHMLRSFDARRARITSPRTRDVFPPPCSASASAAADQKASKTSSTSRLRHGSRKSSTKIEEGKHALARSRQRFWKIRIDLDKADDEMLSLQGRHSHREKM